MHAWSHGPWTQPSPAITSNAVLTLFCRISHTGLFLCLLRLFSESLNSEHAQRGSPVIAILPGAFAMKKKRLSPHALTCEGLKDCY